MITKYLESQYLETSNNEYGLIKQEMLDRYNTSTIQWDKLPTVWESLFNFNLEEEYNIKPQHLKDLLDQKVKKYIPKVRDVTNHILKRYPDGYDENEDILTDAIIELITQFERRYVSPSAINKLWDNGKKDLKVGPSFLKNLKRTFTTPGNIDRKDGSILKAVKGAIFNGLRKRDNMSPYFRAKIKKLQSEVEEYEKKNNEAPTEKYLAMKLDVSIDEVSKLFNLAKLRDVTFSDMLFDQAGGEYQIKLKGGGFNPNNLYEDPEALTLLINELRKSWDLISKNTNKEEATVISLIVFEELTNWEVSKMLATSEDEIDSIFESGIDKIKEKLRIDIFGGRKF